MEMMLIRKLKEIHITMIRILKKNIHLYKMIALLMMILRQRYEIFLSAQRRMVVEIEAGKNCHNFQKEMINV